VGIWLLWKGRACFDRDDNGSGLSSKVVELVGKGSGSDLYFI